MKTHISNPFGLAAWDAVWSAGKNFQQEETE
jgi:hypothetical protein